MHRHVGAPVSAVTNATPTRRPTKRPHSGVAARSAYRRRVSEFSNSVKRKAGGGVSDAQMPRCYAEIFVACKVTCVLLASIP